MKKVNREDFGFISAEIVVGSNCSRKLPPSHRIKIAKQTEVIQGLACYLANCIFLVSQLKLIFLFYRFRQKKYNLLLCTSVLEVLSMFYLIINQYQLFLERLTNGVIVVL